VTIIVWRRSIIIEMTELLAVVLVVAGVFGAFLPVLPGSPLIFIGALVYDYGTNWETFGWLWLGVLFLMMIAVEVAEWWLSNMGAKVGGASWQALLVGTLGGLIGLLFLPLGPMIGAIVGVVGTELVRTRSVSGATKAGGGWFVGWMLSFVLQVAAVAVMTGIFAWRVYF
jgi:uncharacterized protein YqgC (DUF456 family)